MDLLLLIEALFSNTWMLLTGVEYPGLGISIAAIMLGGMVIVISIWVLKRVFGGSK